MFMKKTSEMRVRTSYLCVTAFTIVLLLIGYYYTKTNQVAPITTQVHQKVQKDTYYTAPTLLNGYIVYDCDDQHPGLCGGWSDRMSGMFSAYVISVMLGKHFLIRYTRSSNLTDYLAPSSFDWKYNSTILEDRSWGYQNFVSKTPDDIKNQNLAGLNNLFSKDVNFVRINWDYTEHFRKFPGVQNVIPWIHELHYSDIYLKFFKILFKPTDMITKAVNKVVQNVNKLACAHIRIGRSATIKVDAKRTDEKQLVHIWNLLKAMEARNYSIFIATDAEFVLERARSLFKDLLETEGRILHIDRSAEGHGLVGGYRKVVVDFFVLTKCDVLVLTKSGFGIMSSYLNTNVSKLYCLTPNELVPCSRYTVHNFYPGEILSPV